MRAVRRWTRQRREAALRKRLKDLYEGGRLWGLSEREAMWVRLFVGLEGVPPHSLEQIAALFGVLREEVEAELDALAELTEGPQGSRGGR